MDRAQVAWAEDTLQLLRTLPRHATRVLSMMYFERLDENQICERTGWSARSVRAAAGSGLRQLGRLVEERAVAAHRSEATATAS